MDDLHPDERVESAEFAPRRVGGRGRQWRSLLVLLGWISAICVLVGLAVLGPARNGDRTAIATHAAGTPVATSSTGTLEPVGITAPGGTPRPGGVASLGGIAGPLAFAASRDATTITIAGTVAADPIARLLITVQSISGDLNASQTLTVENPGDDLRPDEPQGFSISIPVPASADGRAIQVEVTAYHGNGGTIGSAGTSVASFAADPSRGRELRLACCSFYR